MYARISCAATQDFGQRRRRGDDAAPAGVRLFDPDADQRITGGELYEALGVKNQGAAYSS